MPIHTIAALRAMRLETVIGKGSASVISSARKFNFCFVWRRFAMPMRQELVTLCHHLCDSSEDGRDTGFDPFPVTTILRLGCRP